MRTHRRRGLYWAFLVLAASTASDARGEAPETSETSLPPWPVVLPVVRVHEKPKLDGKLDDPVWKDLTPATNFVTLQTNQPAQAQTEVLAVFDDEALYFGITCLEPDMGSVVSLATSRDGQVYRDNAVELFLRAARRPGPYCHLAVNTLGTQFDQRVQGDKHEVSWNPEWTAKIGMGKDRWVAEIAIPFQSLGVEPPLPGRRWMTNVTRVCGPSGELTTLARLSGGFHQPEGFVRMHFCFGPNEARVRIKYSPVRSVQPAPTTPTTLPVGAELPAPKVSYEHKPARVTLDDKRWLQVDGKPFFPRMLFLPQGMEGIKQAGFNTVLTGHDKPDDKGQWISANLQTLETAKKQGLWVVLHVCNLLRGDRAQFAELRQLVLALKDHPALLGWYTADEPSGNVTSIAKLRTGYQLIKKHDAAHPVFLLENTPAFFAYWARGTCDVFLADPYVIPSPGAEKVADWTDAAGKAVGKGQAVMMCLQAHGPPWYARYPSPNESRAMAMLAVIHGATGLGWWAHGPAKESPAWSHYRAITSEAARVAFGMRQAAKRELKVDKAAHALSMQVGEVAFVTTVDCSKKDMPVSVSAQGEKAKGAKLPALPEIAPGPPPAPKPAPKKAETKPEPKEKPEPTPKTQPAPSTKPAPKPETKPAPKKAETKPAKKPAPKTEPAPKKAEPKPEPKKKPEPPKKPEPTPKTQPAPSTKPAPKPETKPAPKKAETKPAKKPAPKKAEPKPEPNKKPEPPKKPEPTPKTQPAPSTKPAPKPETKPAPKKAEPKPASKPTTTTSAPATRPGQ